MRTARDEKPLDCAIRDHFHGPLVTNRWTFATVLALAAVAAPVGTASAAGVKLTTVATLDTPMFVTAPPGDTRRLFVAEREGAIRVIKDGKLRSRPFLRQPGVSIRNAEQGMQSMAFAPDYATSGRFYVAFTDKGKDVEVLEYRRSASNPDVADRSTKRTVIVIGKTLPTHNGGTLQFGPDGLLYLSTGDGGCCGDTNNDAQRLNSLLGKILRIDPRPSGKRSYTVPSTNPFVRRRGALGEIYAYGFRNPFRFSFDRTTGDVAIGDVGDVDPDGQEEVDFMPRGKARGANFGWNVFEGRKRNRPGRAPGAVKPAFVYARTGLPCAVIGGVVVRDPKLTALRGRYVYGDSCSGRLSSVKLRRGGSSGNRAFATIGSPTSFGLDASGRVYVTSLFGKLYRLTPR
jgi:glucose/arabinose dehydrogenase